jgi:hypothetical protein
MMRQKIQYIHDNPVKRGYVDLSEHWRYSSYRNYFDTGLEVVFDAFFSVLYLPRSQAPAWECILNNNLNSIKNHLKPCIKIIPITRITSIACTPEQVVIISKGFLAEGLRLNVLLKFHPNNHTIERHALNKVAF